MAAEPHTAGEDYAQDALDELQCSLAAAKTEGRQLEPVYRVWQLKQKVYASMRRDLSLDLFSAERL